MDIYQLGERDDDDDALAIRTIAVSDEGLHLSRVPLADQRAVETAATDDVPLASVAELSHVEGSLAVTIGHDRDGATKYEHVSFGKKKRRERFLRRVSEAGGLQRSEEPLSFLEAAGPALTIGGGAVVASVLFYFVAAGYDGGSPHRGGKYALFKSAVAFVGPTGWLALAALAIAGTAYFLYRAYRHPGARVVYGRP